MNELKNYNVLLKKKRREKNMTQLQVADLVGMSRSYYSDIENGRTLPSGKMLFEINKVLPIFFTNN